MIYLLDYVPAFGIPIFCLWTLQFCVNCYALLAMCPNVVYVLFCYFGLKHLDALDCFVHFLVLDLGIHISISLVLFTYVDSYICIFSWSSGSCSFS
jgi:hypothetical protein